MNDIRFRKAVWMGADWKNIIINAYPYKSGVFARTLLDHTPYFNPEAMKLVPPYNPEEAKKLIQAVEKDAGKKIPPIFWLDSSSSPMRDIGELAKLSLGQIGVPINLQLMSHAIWFDKLLRDPKLEWDMGGYGQGFLRAPTLGFAYWVTNSRTAPDGKSLGGYSNPEFDRWVKLTETSYDEQERVRATHEAEKILVKDAITIPMFVVHNIYAWNKKLKGVQNTNVGTIQVTTGWGANMWLDE
jgi:oligopeptide transport system substrate-binding protein